MARVTRLTLDNTGELDRRRLNFREIAGDADAPLESVGQDLRKARELRSEELDHIARVLKIRQDYLSAIEEGAVETLPGRAYTIGFVRSYAAYLGLDSEEYVERLKAEVAGREDTEEPAAISPPVERKWPQGIWAIGVLLLFALLYAGYYLFFSATRLSEQPVRPVPERLAAEAGLSTGADASAPSPQAQAASSAPVAPPAAVIPPPRAEDPPPATLPSGRSYGVQNTNSRIMLRIHRQSLVTVRDDNNKLFINRTLLPGDTYRVPNISGLKLSAPDSGAVELILDGNSVGFAGDEGAIVTGMPLSPQDLINRQDRG